MTEQSTSSYDGWGDKVWKLPNGELHREDGPAIEYSNGSKEWFLNNVRHREDGPAVEWYDGCKEWWIKGKFIYREYPDD